VRPWGDGEDGGRGHLVPEFAAQVPERDAPLNGVGGASEVEDSDAVDEVLEMIYGEHGAMAVAC
jgi:hypothetical protein